jgi:hypothetical protein
VVNTKCIAECSLEGPASIPKFTEMGIQGTLLTGAWSHNSGCLNEALSG